MGFEDAFGDKSFLMLQDLTYDDIRNYVSSNFEGNPGFAELQRREPSYAKELQQHVAKKAAGVFLWVHLVVQSLLAEHGAEITIDECLDDDAIVGSDAFASRATLAG